LVSQLREDLLLCSSYLPLGVPIGLFLQAITGVSRRKTKPIKIRKPWGVTAPRASSNQKLGVTILDRNRINIKEDTTTRVNSLTNRKEIHSEARNKRNIKNIKGWSRKSATGGDRKGSVISSKNRKRKIKRMKRRQCRRVRSHMKRDSKIQDPRGST
jgi:hypothetical protein